MIPMDKISDLLSFKELVGNEPVNAIGTVLFFTVNPLHFLGGEILAGKIPPSEWVVSHLGELTYPPDIYQHSFTVSWLSDTSQ